jgi:hypothetical protein
MTDEVEIDKTYLNSDFIALLNNLENDKLSGLLALVLDIYEEAISNDQLTYITKVIGNVIGQEADSLDFFRKIKYLINKGNYNRLSKKFKNDLLQLELEEDKVDVIIETQKLYLEKLGEINKRLNKPDLFIKDFDIRTEMPVFRNNNAGHDLDDVRKQNILISLDVEDNNNSKPESDGCTGKFNMEMNKVQLINFYKEIERIQEKLDKLY